MPRLAWLSSLLPLACFSEGDVMPGGSESSGQASSTFTTTTSATTTTPPETSESSTSPTGADLDSGSTTLVDDSSGAPTTSTTTMTSESTDTGEECAPGTVQIPALPIGWEGVFTLSPGGNPGEMPPCPPGQNDEGAAIEDAVAAACNCECDPACWVYMDADSDCMVFEDAYLGAYDEECTNADVLQSFISFDADLAQDGGCDFPEPIAVIDGTRRSACEHIDGTQCVTAPPDFLAPCVRHDGDLACPAGPFSHRVLTVESLDVTCAECDSCEAAAIDACLAGTATLFPEENCQGTGIPVTDFACSPESGSSLIVDFELACPTASARPQQAHGERTYCCVE